MKKAFMAFVITVILVSILAGTLATKYGDSPPYGTTLPNQDHTPEEMSDTQESSTDLASDLPGQPQKGVGAAQQVLTEISDANVSERTEDLKYAFTRLNEICQEAAKVRDAMLSARYEQKQDHAVDYEKEIQSGQE